PPLVPGSVNPLGLRKLQRRTGVWCRSLALSQARHMELTKKIKLALDETRILILGAQILFGFQFRAVFSGGYEELPAALRYLDGFAMLPMICFVALLITPGPYHRAVQNGEDSGSFHGLVTTIANLALVPFAIALGLDVVVKFSHLLGEVSG